MDPTIHYDRTTVESTNQRKSNSVAGNNPFVTPSSPFPKDDEGRNVIASPIPRSPVEERASSNNPFAQYDGNFFHAATAKQSPFAIPSNQFSPHPQQQQQKQQPAQQLVNNFYNQSNLGWTGTPNEQSNNFLQYQEVKVVNNHNTAPNSQKLLSHRDSKKSQQQSLHLTQHLITSETTRQENTQHSHNKPQFKGVGPHPFPTARQTENPMHTLAPSLNTVPSIDTSAYPAPMESSSWDTVLSNATSDYPEPRQSHSWDTALSAEASDYTQPNEYSTHDHAPSASAIGSCPPLAAAQGAIPTSLNFPSKQNTDPHRKNTDSIDPWAFTLVRESLNASNPPHTAVVPSALPNSHPYGVITMPPPKLSVTSSPSVAPEAHAPQALKTQAQVSSNTTDEVDFWAAMGFGIPATNANGTGASTVVDAHPEPENKETDDNSTGASTVVDIPPEPENKETFGANLKLDNDGLPQGGERYNARMNSDSLGVIFCTPDEVASSLFATAETEAIHSLAHRPVIRYVFDGSTATATGVQCGHVLLSVNGKKIYTPNGARFLIREGSRPMQLEFYVPPTNVCEITSEEGMHMVKYDTSDKLAPSTKFEWKPKYVVIGGIIAKPWMMMMYRNKVRN